MDKRQVKIIVASQVASGKSTIIDIIEKALHDNGIACSVNDMDRPNTIDLSERVGYMKDKIEVSIDAAYVKRAHYNDNEIPSMDKIIIHNADGQYKEYKENVLMFGKPINP